MNERDRSIILELKKVITRWCKDHIRKVVAFGSRVRGEGSEDSDLDLLILVDRKGTWNSKLRLEDVAYQVMWDHDFKPILSIKFLYRVWLSQPFERRLFLSIKTSEREGVSLWKRRFNVSSKKQIHALEVAESLYKHGVIQDASSKQDLLCDVLCHPSSS